MSTNPGVAPPNPETAVGRLRRNIGDTTYTDLEPPIAGQGNYEWFSDADLDALLVTARDSVTRATGLALQGLAFRFAMTASTVATEDLRVDTTKRAAMMQEAAATWLAQADIEDAAAAAEAFSVIGFNRDTPAVM